MPWPWGLVDFAARAVTPVPGSVRATIRLPHCTARLVRAGGVLPADGSRRVVLYMHGGGFLTCGANTHDRLVTTLSEYADTPVLVTNYRMMPKHSIGEAIDDCYDGYRWLRGRGYGPDQIVLAGDSVGGYLSLALAERLLNEGEELAAIVCMSPLMQIAKVPRQAHPNIRSDAMFPVKAFDAFVDLIAKAGQRHIMDGQPRGDLRAARPHRGRSAPHVDPCIRFRGPAARRSAGRAAAGRGRSTGPAAGVAWPDARVPDRRADGAGG